MTVKECPPADLAMDRYATGDDAAFAALYDALGPILYGSLRRRVRSVQMVEDLVQQTFLVMHRARVTFILGSPVAPWACAIARRLLIDELRKNQRSAIECEAALDEATTCATTPTPDEELAVRELAAAFDEALSELPVTQRQAFELLRTEGLSHAKAARDLGTTVNAIKLRAHRAYVALRTRHARLGRCRFSPPPRERL